MSIRALRPILLAAILAVPAAAQSSLSFVTSRAALGANDSLAWSALGSGSFFFVSNDFSVDSEDGLGVQVHIPAAPAMVPPITSPLVFQTGLPQNGLIPTNFSAGDHILFTGLQLGGTAFPTPGNPGPLEIRFQVPIFGAGTQFAVDDIPTWSVTLSVYDLANRLIGSLPIDGASSTALDSSAVFLGVLSDTPNVSRLVYSSSEPGQAIGINQLSLLTVPEPGGVFALGLLIVALRHGTRRTDGRCTRPALAETGR